MTTYIKILCFLAFKKFYVLCYALSIFCFSVPFLKSPGTSVNPFAFIIPIITPFAISYLAVLLMKKSLSKGKKKDVRIEIAGTVICLNKECFWGSEDTRALAVEMDMKEDYLKLLRLVATEPHHFLVLEAVK